MKVAFAGIQPLSYTSACGLCGYVFVKNGFQFPVVEGARFRKLLCWLCGQLGIKPNVIDIPTTNRAWQLLFFSITLGKVRQKM